MTDVNKNHAIEEKDKREFKCFNCGLAYATIQQLNVHKQNFCKNSDYGDVEKLRRKIN